jgi:cbb3-type cytochrome oxidase subunit 3
MKQAVLSHWDHPLWPVAALIMFVLCFVAYTYWTYRKDNKKFYEEASLIPLHEPESAGSHTKGHGV